MIMAKENYAPYVTRKEIIPAEKFLELSYAQRNCIVSAKIVPPSLEGSGFGFIEIEYKHQRYNLDAIFA